MLCTIFGVGQGVQGCAFSRFGGFCHSQYFARYSLQILFGRGCQRVRLESMGRHDLSFLRKTSRINDPFMQGSCKSEEELGERAVQAWIWSQRFSEP